MRDYRRGDPIPPGFHIKKIKRGPLLLTGAIAFGASYVASVVMSIEQSIELVNSRPASASQGTAFPVNPFLLPFRYDNDFRTFLPLVLPVAGPFITIFTAQSSGVGTVLLIADGTVQAAGLGLLIASSVSPSLKLVRFKTGKASFSIVPSMGPGAAGIGVAGAM